MFEGYKVVVVCPAGRRHVAELMRRYIEQTRPLVDELHWWLNTDLDDDLAYFRGLEAAAPDFYKTLGAGYCAFNKRHMQIGRFFRFAIDPDTIYIRVDDDIVWMDKDCIKNLVTHRLAYPDAYLVYGNIVNSSRFMHLHQQQGAFDPGFEIAYEISHHTNRLSVPAGLAAHRAILNTAEAIAAGGGDREKLLEPWTRFGRHVFGPGIYNDVNMICWFGRDFAAWRGICPKFVFEEIWICLRMPCKFGGRIHEACGGALCSHFASVPQWAAIAGHTELLDRYYKLAPKSEITTLLLQE